MKKKDKQTKIKYNSNYVDPFENAVHWGPEGMSVDLI